MINAGQSVLMIEKTLETESRRNLMNYNDIRSWKVEMSKELDGVYKMKSDVNELVDFLTQNVILNKSNLGNYDSDASLKVIFYMQKFALKEVEDRGEVYVFGAKYTNQSSEDTTYRCQTFLTLGAMTSFGNRERVDAPVFALDISAALMNGLELAFPENSMVFHCSTEESFSKKLDEYKRLAHDKSFVNDSTSPVAWINMEQNWVNYRERGGKFLPCIKKYDMLSSEKSSIL
ncbi:hypothetical protein BDB01DRAFT_836927 [Pilobolus umbonatus]|nr:hypothetical protein BDB01DRAFT_836927 [Pilobolus umbonatus]